MSVLRGERTETAHELPIVFFDGVCALCDGFVRFVVARDRARRFRFAPLQGPTYRSVSGAEASDLASIVLADRDGSHVRSAAVLRVLARLGGPWGPLARVLLLVPRPLADWAYRCVARHRYRWFGRREYCALPRPEDRGRFLP